MSKKYVQLALTEAEFDLIQQAAQRDQRTVRGLARMATIREAKRIIGEGGTVIEHVGKRLSDAQLDDWLSELKRINEERVSQLKAQGYMSAGSKDS